MEESANIRLEIDADRVATVWLDLQGKSVNTFTPPMLADLAAVVDKLAGENPVAVIFASAKPRSFVAGADLFEIRKMDAAQIAQFLSAGQTLFSRIAALPMPTVAAIGGDCLGGGLELALACRYRVAADDSSISIGLPETKLGILPGWGGTTRLPRLIGLRQALPILTAGKTMPPKRARRAGIIDETVRPERLLWAARRLVLAGGPPHRPSRFDRFLLNFAPARHRVLKIAAEQTQKITHGHYPAAQRVIEVVKIGLDRGLDAGLTAERQALVELAQTPAAQNLMRIFFLRQGARRAVADAIGPAEPRKISVAAVIGGGTMGAGIIHALIRAGISVRLVEVNPKAVSAALFRVRKMLDDDVSAGRLDALSARHAFDRVSPTLQGAGLALADVVIEAALEQSQVKRDIFAKLGQACREDTLLASNTSSLSIAEMAAASGRPSQVVGLHFFNPVPKMPLVEIVRTPQSDPAALATALALTQRLGKTPVLVRDSPGFLVNRVLIPYLAEAMALVESGGSIEVTDQVIRDWGMPMGPFELLDEIGLDVAYFVLQSLSGRLGERLPTPALAEKALKNGWLGRKTGRGFYVYDRKHSSTKQQLNIKLLKPVNVTMDPALADRLILPMVNEAARLLEEHIVDSPDAIDLATVMGLGFAPFRGGLARFADTLGPAEIVRRLESLSQRLGPRFTPAPLLKRLAAEGKSLSQFADSPALAAPTAAIRY